MPYAEKPSPPVDPSSKDFANHRLEPTPAFPQATFDYCQYAVSVQ